MCVPASPGVFLPVGGLPLTDAVGERSAPLRAHGAVFASRCHALNSTHLARSQRGSHFFRVPVCHIGHCTWCTTKGGQGKVLPSREDDAS